MLNNINKGFGLFQKQAHFILGVPFLVWVLFVFNYISLPSAASLTHVLVIAGLLVWRWWKSDSQDWQISKAVLLIGFFVIFQLIQLSVTPLPQSSLINLLQNIAVLLTIVVFELSIYKDTEILQWERALITFLIVLFVLELLPVFLWYLSWWNLGLTGTSTPPVGFRLPGLFVWGPNNLVAYANLLLPFILVGWLNSKSRGNKIKLGLSLLLVGLIEYYSSSRSGWISAIAAVGVTLFLNYFPILKTYFIGTKIDWQKIPPLNRLKVLYGGVYLLILGGLGKIFLRQIQRTPGHYGILSGREYIWANSFEVWRESLIWGNGARSYPVLYAKQTLAPPGFLPGNAHSLWMQLGVESGIVGIVFTLLLIALVGRSWIRAWKAASSSGDKRNRLTAYAGVITASLVFHFAAYMFEFYLYTFSLLLICVFILAQDPDRPVISMNKNWGMLILLGFIVIYTWGTYHSNLGTQAYQTGLHKYIQNTDTNASQELICKASQENPEFTFYAFQCSLISAQLAVEQDDRSLIEFAVEIQSQALERDPYWPVHWANLALLRWQLGDHQQAVADLQHAVENAPRNAVLALNLGWMEEQMGQDETAKSHYTAAIINDPWIVESLFWDENELRRGVLLNLPPEDIDVNSPQIMALRGNQALHNGQVELARITLETSIRRFPTEAEAYAILGLLEQSLGNEEKAWENIQLALFVTNDSPRILI
ncbi:MAG: O-antigen ligase family protein, partial [Anaerolineae bacterium]|nr:O-antigen ligase family protein [Anaerolineae bacterium]